MNIGCSISSTSLEGACSIRSLCGSSGLCSGSGVGALRGSSACLIYATRIRSRNCRSHL